MCVANSPSLTPDAGVLSRRQPRHARDVLSPTQTGGRRKGKDRERVLAEWEWAGAGGGNDEAGAKRWEPGGAWEEYLTCFVDISPSANGHPQLLDHVASSRAVARGLVRAGSGHVGAGRGGYHQNPALSDDASAEESRFSARSSFSPTSRALWPFRSVSRRRSLASVQSYLRNLCFSYAMRCCDEGFVEVAALAEEAFARGILLSLCG